MEMEMELTLTRDGRGRSAFMGHDLRFVFVKVVGFKLVLCVVFCLNFGFFNAHVAQEHETPDPGQGQSHINTTGLVPASSWCPLPSSVLLTCRKAAVAASSRDWRLHRKIATAVQCNCKRRAATAVSETRA
jgi:hypothetical protein